MPIATRLSLLLLLCLAACGPDSSAQPSIHVPEEPAQLVAGGQLEVVLSLSGIAPDEVVIWSSPGLPQGLHADFRPARGDAASSDALLVLTAEEDVAIGAADLTVTAETDTDAASATLALSVLQGLSGKVLMQDGRPIEGAIVEILGVEGLRAAVDPEGNWFIPHAQRPYDLRVVWVEEKRLHEYRQLEADSLELRPFEWEVQFPANSMTVTGRASPWDAAESGLRGWLTADGPLTQHVSRRSVSSSDRFSLKLGFEDPAEAALHALSVQTAEGGQPISYTGYGSTAVTLEDGETAELGVFELQPVESYPVHPALELPTGLRLDLVCAALEAPSARPHLGCTRAIQWPLMLPVIDGHTGLVALEFKRGRFESIIVALRDLEPGTPTPTVILPFPPELTHAPPSEGPVDATGARFGTNAQGSGPITYSFTKSGGVDRFELHLTTTEREVSLPSIAGAGFELNDPGLWTWRVRQRLDGAGLDDPRPGALSSYAWLRAAIHQAPPGSIPAVAESTYLGFSPVW